MKQIIITGCPRTGSRYVRACFAYEKIPAKHEADCDITISPYLAVETDLYGFTQRHEPYWSRVVDEIWHLVRDPMLCIPSMAQHIPSRFWIWQSQLTGLHPTMFRNKREFAAHFWVKWNIEAESRGPCWRFKIEEFEKAWPQMWERLELGPAPTPDPRAREYRGIDLDRQRDKKYRYLGMPAMNRNDREPLTGQELMSWGKTIHDSVFDMAERYGYFYE